MYPWMGFAGRIGAFGAAALLLALGGAPGPAEAGGFSVAPVRLFFGERDRAVAVRLSNEADQELVLRADLQAWSQDEQGHDRLEPSDDLIVSPPMMRVPARGEQTVRVLLAVPRDASRQMSYRLILREEVSAVDAAAPETARLPIALALSLPLFITPRGASHGLQCELGPIHRSTTTVLCENHGTAHARLGRLDLLDGGIPVARHEGSVYLLPGSRRVIELAREGRSGELGHAGDRGADVARSADPARPIDGAQSGQTLRALLDGQELRVWPVGRRVAGP